MNNAIVVMVYDRTTEQFELSVKAYESAVAQDMPVDVFVLDNGSTCEATKDWLRKIEFAVKFRYEQNIAPTIASNAFLKELFKYGYDCVFGIPNDVILPPNLYRKMLEFPQDMVTPGMHGTNPPAIMEEVHRIHGDIHMATCMIRKSAYDKMVAKYGYFFDENYFMYASDCDMKMRFADAGITTAQLDILCWHYGGASHRLGIGGSAAYAQADRDREYFQRKWGHPISSEQYGAKVAAL